MKTYDFALEITQDDLDQGEPADIRGCAIARAAACFFKSAFEQTKVPETQRPALWTSADGIIHIVIGGATFDCTAPWAERVASRFDAGQHVAPQTLYFTVRRV